MSIQYLGGGGGGRWRQRKEFWGDFFVVFFPGVPWGIYFTPASSSCVRIVAVTLHAES